MRGAWEPAVGGGPCRLVAASLAIRYCWQQRSRGRGTPAADGPPDAAGRSAPVRCAPGLPWPACRPRGAGYGHWGTSPRSAPYRRCRPACRSIRPRPSSSWRRSGDGIAVTTKDGTAHASAVILVAGPWAPQALAELRLPLSIRRIVAAHFDAIDPSQYSAEDFSISFRTTPESVFAGFPHRPGEGVKIMTPRSWLHRPCGNPYGVIALRQCRGFVRRRRIFRADTGELFEIAREQGEGRQRTSGLPRWPGDLAGRINTAGATCRGLRYPNVPRAGTADQDSGTSTILPACRFVSKMRCASTIRSNG